MEMTQSLFKLILLENGFREKDYGTYSEPNSIYYIDIYSHDKIATICKNGYKILDVHYELEDFIQLIHVYFPKIKFDEKILNELDANIKKVKCQLSQIAKVDKNYIPAVISAINKWYENEFTR